MQGIRQIDRSNRRDPSARGPYAKSAVTKRLILDSARDLFIRRGFDAVSLRDIATASGLSHPALRRYFDSTAAILDALVQRYELENYDGVLDAVHQVGALEASIDLARRNAEHVGYIELFTALAGVAASAEHPAHERMAARYRAVREAAAAGVGPGRSDAALVPALVDGLQIASLFDPRIDIPTEVALFVAWWRQGGIVRVPSIGVVGNSGHVPFAADGTRDRILRHAAENFAMRGYYSTRVSDIASAAGIAKSTLLHHYASKQDLLISVLVDLERRSSGSGDPAPDLPPARVRRFVDLACVDASATEDEVAALEAHVVLLCESTSPEHPGHAWYSDRISDARLTLAADIAASTTSGVREVSSDRAALWLHAARDGLRLQWIYDRELPVTHALRGLCVSLVGDSVPSDATPSRA